MFDGDAVIEALAIVLHDVVSANEAAASSDAAAASSSTSSAPLHQREVTKFCSSYAPAVSVEAYLHRIRKYAKCSDSCFIVALIYTDRVINSHKFNLTSLNVHRMILTAVLLAAKFLDDTYYNNSFYAQLGGICLSEMNTLELEFLSLTRFELNVTENHYGQYHSNLKGYVGRKLPQVPLTLSVPALYMDPCACSAASTYVVPAVNYNVVTPPARMSPNMWATAGDYGWYQTQQTSAYDMSYDMPTANMDADAGACSTHTLSSFSSVYADVSDDDDLHSFPACGIPVDTFTETSPNPCVEREAEESQVQMQQVQVPMQEQPQTQYQPKLAYPGWNSDSVNWNELSRWAPAEALVR
jgi:hypothetical protein